MRWLKEQIDLWAIRAAAKFLPRIAADPNQRAEVELALTRTDLFVPPETVPVVSLRPDFSFTFKSSVKTPFPKNNTVHGRLFPAGDNWRKRPSVLLVHGWNAEAHYTSVMPRIGRLLASRGINGATMELPYHLHRRPALGEAMTNFISENIPRMLEATSQAVADLNGILCWLKQEGSPGTALWGFSLGGWLTGLHLCRSEAQDAAVLTTPVANLEQAVRELEFCHPIRAALQVAPVDLQSLNLAAGNPRIAPEKILLIEARYDRFVPGETYIALARSWGIKEWPRVAQSHLSILISRRVTSDCVEWLERSLQVQQR